MADWTEIHTDFKRDRWGRPLVIPTTGGTPAAYMRCTKYIDVIDDKYGLQQWDKRQVAVGIAQREDLRMQVLAHLDDNAELNRACDAAKEYALASAAATKGTAFHSLTDLIDRGQPIPDGLPANVIATLEAFREATAMLKPVAIEPPTVLDTYRVAGTPDRIYEYNGERYIGDTKTGKITYGARKIAAQLSVYSRSWIYNVATGERTAHGASTNRGIVIDVDLDACTVNLVWIDLEAGWEAVKVAAQVWGQRLCPACRDKHRSTCSHHYDLLTAPFGDMARPSLHLEKRDAAAVQTRADLEREQLLRSIASCTTPDLVRGLWRPDWDDALTAAAAARVAELDAAATTLPAVS